ncbi:MAG: hypothetical protein AAFR87_16480, partial [Bacteroidota bacterium]
MARIILFTAIFSVIQSGISQITPPVYPSGQPMAEGTYLVDSTNKILIRDGLWEYFYEDGQLKSKGEYLLGQKVNEWISYDFDGKISSRGSYCYDSLVSMINMVREDREFDSVLYSLDWSQFEPFGGPKDTLPETVDSVEKNFVEKETLIDLDPILDSTSIKNRKELATFDEFEAPPNMQWTFSDEIYIGNFENSSITKRK